MNHHQPFFVIGAPGSGTSMLQAALNRLPHIVMVPDTGFFTLLRHSRRKQQIHWSRIEDRLQIRVASPNCRIRAGAGAREQFERIVNAYLDRINCRGITHFGEGSADLQCRIPLIMQTFPEAKLVLIYRDGRDVALNLANVPGTRKSLYGHFLTWLKHYRIQRRFLQQHPQRVFCVRYEDLVRNTGAELQLIIEFLGVDCDPGIAERCDNQEGNPDRELSGKNNVREAANPCGSCPDLSLRELMYLERWGGWALRELHYECAAEIRGLLPSWQIPMIYGRFAFEAAAQMLERRPNEQARTCFINPAE